MRNVLSSPVCKPLELDWLREADEIGQRLRQVLRRLRRRGLVVGLSGGIDSSVVAALAVRSLGARHVLGVSMPERDSDPETRQMSRTVAEHLGIEWVEQDITEALKALGCYRRRDEAIASVVPGYGPGYRCKVVLPNLLDRRRYNLFSLVVAAPDGTTERVRLPLEAYLQIVAASNFKQRVRKTLEYYHADRLNYAVAGTPNRLEYDQGFFVKQGDGAADVKPIAHLYKTQVYALGRALGLPRDIVERAPTTDTYSLPQSQEEFYFAVPYSVMDLCLYGRNQGVGPERVAAWTGLSAEQVQRVYEDIDRKRQATRYQQAAPVLLKPVPEIKHCLTG